MIKVAYTNIQFKIKINGLLSDPFTLRQGVCQRYSLLMLLYIISTKVLASFINIDKEIRGIQIRDHETKIVNLANNTTNFLNFENIIFQKAKPYVLKHVKIELINQDKWNGYNCPLILVTLSLITAIRTN